MDATTKTVSWVAFRRSAVLTCLWKGSSQHTALLPRGRHTLQARFAGGGTKQDRFCATKSSAGLFSQGTDKRGKAPTMPQLEHPTYVLQGHRSSPKHRARLPAKRVFHRPWVHQLIPAYLWANVADRTELITQISSTTTPSALMRAPSLNINDLG